MKLIDGHYTAANWVALGILYNTGQDCTAGSRLFVQDTIYERFIEVCELILFDLCVEGFPEADYMRP